MLFVGQLLIVPVTKSTVTSAVAQSNIIQSSGDVQSDNAVKANEVVESDGAPTQKRTSPKKTVSTEVHLNVC